MKRCCNDISKRITKRTTRGSIGPQRCHSGYGMVNDMGIHPVKPADKMMWSMDSCVVNGSVGHDAKPQMNYTLSVTLPHEQLAIMIDTVDLRWDPYTKEMIVLVVCRWVDGGYVQGLSHELLYCRASHTGDAGRGRGREREGDVIWTCEHDMLRVGGLSWGYVGPAWGYVGPSWGYVGLCLCAQSVVIYSILRCEMARTRVNTTVLVPESG